MKNAIYAQSGGVTSVINSSALGVIHACQKHNNSINNLYAAQNGILGILEENIIDTSLEDESDINNLLFTPGGAFGSCRYKIDPNKTHEYERLLEVFKTYNIGYFFYNGGNDSADTCLKVANLAQKTGYDLKAIHIPKTIDNDLVITDNCPGFGSVAKYIITSIIEASYDIASMHKTSTKVFIMEVMGRNAGWIAASSGLASNNKNKSPHLILFPEIIFDEIKFLKLVEKNITENGYCVIVASEGIKNKEGQLITSSNVIDAFGHHMLGGVAIKLASIIKEKLNHKCHYAICDYLQRSARHIGSKVDVEQAYQLGYKSVEYAVLGHTNIMPYIKRLNSSPYMWDIDYTDLNNIANKEKFMPRNFIDQDGFHITELCKEYIKPLINGESIPNFIDGIPNYTVLKNLLVTKKLPIYNK
jgi:6-phosphofructokinase